MSVGRDSSYMKLVAAFVVLVFTFLTLTFVIDRADGTTPEGNRPGRQDH